MTAFGSSASVVSSICIALGTLYLARRIRTRRARKLPPGPQRTFILGNIAQMPKEKEWLTYQRWTEEYGDVVYLEILGQPIIVLDSLEAATDLLEARGAIYSGRPRLPMAGDLTGFAQGVALATYGSRFRELRKSMQRELGVNMVQRYQAIYQDGSRQLALSAIKASGMLRELVVSARQFAGFTIMKSTYGYTTAPKNDKWLLATEDVMAIFSSAATPGRWMVDIFPALMHLPEWLPGTGFKRTARKWRQMNENVVREPYCWAKDNQDSDSGQSLNFVSSVLGQSREGLTNEEEDIAIWAAGSIFGGGADTTVSAILTFLLAMALSPESQRRGQEEIDAIIGRERLANIADRSNTPFVDAIMKETLRWHPVAPLAIPHLLTQDDEYRGWTFTSGSLFMVNLWSILHNKDVFPDPESFNPERFLTGVTAEKAIKTVKYAFGFGRRSCPGIHYAEASLYVAIATILATCDISDPRDDSGKPITGDHEWQSGTISHPRPYTVKIKPRSESALNLLQGGA
ncbi:cytochrome P450 [Hygrophoropsis aurantiaca]|uniref:Cytochrome P450 n=1 Tax=Hygrophoropsis aurantiaca TaxID=72124 RepID=A0ACB8AL88_9AGAM|nr:cytochrome P450 [Hygrophoropsis aurantiaca]